MRFEMQSTMPTPYRSGKHLRMMLMREQLSVKFLLGYDIQRWALTPNGFTESRRRE